MNAYAPGAVFLAVSSLTVGFTIERLEAQETADYRQAMAQWHREREASLKGPDGWLNLAGLYWLDPGTNSFGSAPDNDIVLPEGRASARLGAFVLEEGNVTFPGRAGGGSISLGRAGDTDTARPRRSG